MTFLLDIIQRETGEKITTLYRYFSSIQEACAWAESVANAWAMQSTNTCVTFYLHT